jgi:hypothetical protein
VDRRIPAAGGALFLLIDILTLFPLSQKIKIVLNFDITSFLLDLSKISALFIFF